MCTEAIRNQWRWCWLRCRNGCEEIKNRRGREGFCWVERERERERVCLYAGWRGESLQLGVFMTSAFRSSLKLPSALMEKGRKDPGHLPSLCPSLCLCLCLCLCCPSDLPLSVLQHGGVVLGCAWGALALATSPTTHLAWHSRTPCKKRQDCRIGSSPPITVPRYGISDNAQSRLPIASPPWQQHSLRPCSCQCT